MRERNSCDQGLSLERTKGAWCYVKGLTVTAINAEEMRDSFRIAFLKEVSQSLDSGMIPDH